MTYCENKEANSNIQETTIDAKNKENSSQEKELNNYEKPNCTKESHCRKELNSKEVKPREAK